MPTLVAGPTGYTSNGSVPIGSIPGYDPYRDPYWVAVCHAPQQLASAEANGGGWLITDALSAGGFEQAYYVGTPPAVNNRWLSVMTISTGGTQVLNVLQQEPDAEDYHIYVTSFRPDPAYINGAVGSGESGTFWRDRDLSAFKRKLKPEHFILQTGDGGDFTNQWWAFGRGLLTQSECVRIAQLGPSTPKATALPQVALLGEGFDIGDLYQIIPIGIETTSSFGDLMREAKVDLPAGSDVGHVGPGRFA